MITSFSFMLELETYASPVIEPIWIRMTIGTILGLRLAGRL